MRKDDDQSLTPTEADGWFLGILPEGCRLCIQGMKLVYFMGGDCAHPVHCQWYCPISNERKNTISHFADEIPIKNLDSVDAILTQLLYEAKLIDAQGMSFTGGEPLRTPAKVDLVVKLIQGMKVAIGENFHVHLYTSGITFDSYLADKLEEAGLDELRFHPDEKDFFRLDYAGGRKFKFGAEVPLIPTEENHQYLLKLADHLDMIGADFLNLNEFEMCPSNQSALEQRNFKMINNTISAVEGSRGYGEKFIREFKPRGGLSIHFCPAALKDGVQLKRRYLRRAHNIQRSFEDITDEGTLLFLEIKGSVQEINKIINELNSSGMPSKLYEVNLEKGTIELPPILAEDKSFRSLLRNYNVEAGLVEIYPFREPEVAFRCEYTPILNKNISGKISRKKK